jgi:hypothetical protein
MNISDYSTKVKNLADVLASIGALVDDEDLVAMTLNGLGKNYSQFCISIIIRETFLNFQDLITLLINEDMRIIGTSSNGGSQESAFYSNTNKNRGRSKPHFEVDMETCMVDIINMKVNLMEVDEETSKEEEEEVMEVMEVVVEVIEVNNQIVTQTTTIVGNPGTLQSIVIKGSMMDEMKSYNKGIMHQLAIKVMN